MVIDGRRISKKVFTRLAREPVPRRELAAVLVGNDPSSRSFIERKARAAQALGIRFKTYSFPRRASEARLVRAVRALSRRNDVGGIIVQLPLPPGVTNRVIEAVNPEKDVDCLTSARIGSWYAGRTRIAPPSVGALEEVLREFSLPRSARAGVVGSGTLIGKPVSLWLALQKRFAEIGLFRSGARDLRKKLKTYDLIIAGADESHIFRAQDMKRGATVIDFGFADRNGMLMGNLVPPRAGGAGHINYTPTPGGTGPILVAKLFENFYGLSASAR